jgi:pyridoxamine 5'-phosphate oxidase-like protein
MPSKQGDLGLLNDRLAQQLLQSTAPARLAYTWVDGTPRVLPIGFHWDGRQLILGTPAHAPKLKALSHNPKVALTMDTNEFPYKVLLVRGTAVVDVTQGIVPEYELMVRRTLGGGADAWLEQVEALIPAMGGMARIAITPEWVGFLDFEHRLPSEIERAVATISARPAWHQERVRSATRTTSESDS